MIGAVTAIEEVDSTSAACHLLGVARSNLYRWRAPVVHGPAPARPPRAGPAWSLEAAEREAVLAVLTSEAFVDKAPEQVWAILLDQGVYLASVSTMYRILREGDAVRERRAQAVHPARAIPHLVATGPGQVWTWDITKLKTPTKGTYFDLYAIMDIYSRKMIHWEVHHTETGELAKGFIEAAIAADGGTIPGHVHSDNGTSMTSKNVATLLEDLNITRSLSRPRVSNDNPFSESAFKTLKYCPAFPDLFVSIGEARDFTGDFFGYYNHEHRHSGIGLYTPSTVHDGTWKYVRDARQEVLDAAFDKHPARFMNGRPRAAELPETVWINKINTGEISSTDSHTDPTT